MKRTGIARVRGDRRTARRSVRRSRRQPARRATTAASATTGGSERPRRGGAHRPPAEPTEATDIGITATEIHIGVVADVDTPISPGLSQPLVSRGEGVGRPGQRERRARRPQGRRDVLRLEAQPRRSRQRVHPGVPERVRDRRLGRVRAPQPRSDPDVQGQERQRDRPARRRRARDQRGSGDVEVDATRIILAGQDFTAPSRRSPSRSTAGTTTSASSAVAASRRTSSASIPACPASVRASSRPARPLTDLGGKFAGKVVYPDALRSPRRRRSSRRSRTRASTGSRARRSRSPKLMAEARVQGLDMTQGRVDVHVAVPVAVVPRSQNAAAVDGLCTSAQTDAVRRDRRRGREGATARASPTTQDVSANGLRPRTPRRWPSRIFVNQASSTTDGVNGLTRQSLLDLLATRSDGRQPRASSTRAMCSVKPIAVLGHRAGRRAASSCASIPRASATFSCDPNVDRADHREISRADACVDGRQAECLQSPPGPHRWHGTPGGWMKRTTGILRVPRRSPV